MVQSRGQFIGGQWITAGETPFTSLNPATGEVIWSGVDASSKEVDFALKAARNAFEQWALISLEDRMKFLERFQEVLSARQDEFAKIIAMETGKPFWESRSEVASMINKIPVSVKAYHSRCPMVTRFQSGAMSVTRHRPHGVVAVLGPFNFPGHLPNGHCVPALLAGNTVIFKPSDQTPFVAEYMASCWEEAGFPPGVVNMIQGGSKTGQLLATSPEIDGLFFTGSYETGRHLSTLFAKHPEKILALEMGGNNPLVVADVKEIDAAVYYTIQSAFITAGQRCSCARRLIVIDTPQNRAYLDKLIAAIGHIKIGPYTELPEPFMGPVISNNAADHLLSHYDWLITMGARPITEMKRFANGMPFLKPGLVDVTKLSDLPDKEVFGPLLQLVMVKDLPRAIREANRTGYGLAAAIFSDNEEDYRRFFAQVKAGVINWNSQTTGASSSAPFGGVGKSGNHRPSAFYAADYCAYPVASMETETLALPETLTPGISLDFTSLKGTDRRRESFHGL